MDQAKLLDRVRWGMNIAARAMGETTDLFRPRAAADPLDPTHRILRMHAAFLPRRGGFQTNNGYGDALWRGIFDAAYTQPGDYLVQPGRTLFIARQNGLAEPLCVQTNRTIAISRASQPGIVGTVPYSGFVENSATVMLDGWPASVLGVGESGKPTAGLPNDVPVPSWTVLLPAWDGVQVQSGDLYADDLGRDGVVASSELAEMGWRLTVKQATT